MVGSNHKGVTSTRMLADVFLFYEGGDAFYGLIIHSGTLCLLLPVFPGSIKQGLINEKLRRVKD
jgi:hypothetical protein